MPTRILVLFPYELWTRKMSCVRRHAIWELESRADVVLEISGQGWPNYEERLPLAENIERIMPAADVLFWYKPLGDREIPALVDPTARRRSETRCVLGTGPRAAPARHAA